MRVILPVLAALALSACASLSDRAAASLNSQPLKGVHWGLVVTTLEGRELIAINPDDRFLPASNTKLFTVAAAFHTLGDMARADPAFGTSIRLITSDDGAPPSLFLVGAGDPTLIDAPDCQQNCLSDLVNAVLLNGVKEVETVIADETLYPREPWPPGWNQDDMVSRSGAPVSALTVNSNELGLIVRPGADVGEPSEINYRDGPELYDINNHVDTIAADSPLETYLVAERFPDEPDDIRVFGRIKANSPPVSLPVSVHDTAWAAGMRLKLLLESRGIPVTDGVEARYRPLKLLDETATAFTSPRPGIEIARLVPRPLIEDVTFLMKQSQNLHAELLLRRVGLVHGDGTREAGLKQVGTMLSEIGVPRWSWDFFDGSGMSTYNRVTPRTVAQLLHWTTQQPWGQDFRDTLPIGGVDGTLRRRFTGTPLEGRIFAKTGTLMGTNALSGFLTTKSGKTLIFSAYANDRPSGAPPAIDTLDATLVTIAETN
jgi:D-alanyl-D-alanine carboxypeptidase/D-alanyl-D-alanine-endopeptidase (penicillin-binding protein 4)